MSGTLTIEILRKAKAILEEEGPPCVGIVCRPDWLQKVRRQARFCGVSGVMIVAKESQDEPTRLFYNETELREYLNQ